MAEMYVVVDDIRCEGLPDASEGMWLTVKTPQGTVVLDFTARARVVMARELADG